MSKREYYEVLGVQRTVNAVVLRLLAIGGVAVGLATAAAANPTAVSDRYILDELRLSEMALRNAIPKRNGYIVGFTSQLQTMRSDLLAASGSEYTERNKACLKALEAFVSVGLVVANILEPNQREPLYPPEKEQEGLQSDWDNYRAARKECEQSLRVPSVEILPDRLTDALSELPASRRPDIDPVSIDPDIYSKRYLLDGARDSEVKLRVAIAQKSGDKANLVAHKLFDGVWDTVWSKEPTWPLACSGLSNSIAIVGLFATGILDPSRTSLKDRDKALSELDQSWNVYRSRREACENELSVAPVKILPDRLSEAF